MDNTLNNQNPLGPTSPVPPPSQNGITGAFSPQQQSTMPTTPGSTYSTQPMQQDTTQQSGQNPQESTGNKRITLDDLYGPSGFANETPSLTPLSDQQTLPSVAPVTTSQPAANPQPVPMQVVRSDESVIPSTIPPLPPQQPIQPQLYGVPTATTTMPESAIASGSPTAPSANVSPVSDFSHATIPQSVPGSAQSISQPTTSSVSSASVAASQQQASLPVDLPLRKQVLQSQGQQSQQPIQTDPVQTVIPKNPPSDPSSGNPKGPNKFFLLRLLFGGIGIIIVIVLLYFGVTLFSSLSQPEGGSGKVTLTYWGLWEDANTMQSVISQFEQTHPNITIQYEKEDPKEYSQRLLTRIQQGNGPDIFTYHSSWLPLVQPVLVPLPTSVVSKQDLETKYYPVVRNDLVRNGALYGIPLGIDTLSLFVNNKIFQDAKAQVPTSWDTFVTVARALTVKDENGKIKVAGAAMGTFDNITHAPDILSALFMQNGVDVTKMQPASNASDALSFYTSFATGDSNVWDSTLDPSMLAFARGNLAMYFGYSWDIFLIKASNPNLDFSIYPIPHLPGRNTTAASYWVTGVSGKSIHQKEALAFMQFLASKNTQATLYAEEAKTRLFGEPYAQTDLGATLKGNALVYPFVAQATDAKSSFFAGETFDSALNGQMNGYLGNAIRGVLGNTSPDSAIDTLMQGVLQIEKQYGSG